MRRHRILVVEDNALNRRLVRDVLELGGHEVHEACTVDDARALLAEATFDVVVMDIQVPGGGGLSLLREMRGQQRLAEVPVVAVTASSMHGDRERLLQAGFDGYLSKPIDTRTFAASIVAFVREERGKEGGHD
jgi:CheY-like chemotaxis protein